MNRMPSANGTVGRMGSRSVCIAREAMACEFSLLFPGCCTAVDAGCAALDEVERIEQKLSIFLPESDITRVNNRASSEPVALDEGVFSLLRTAARITAESSGAFDAASGALVRAWGFAGGIKHVPAAYTIQNALAASGMRHVELSAQDRTVRFRRPGVEINLGGIGKGFAIDRALEHMGPRTVLMQGGQSSLRAVGAWKVAIGDPFRHGATVASVWLRDRALGTSGIANQFFTENGRRYGHILDPRTGLPAAQLASASALAATATEADALSTAFFVMGLDGTRRYCRQHPGTGAVLITRPEAPGGPQVIAIGLREGELELPRR